MRPRPRRLEWLESRQVMSADAAFSFVDHGFSPISAEEIVITPPVAENPDSAATADMSNMAEMVATSLLADRWPNILLNPITVVEAQDLLLVLKSNEFGGHTLFAIDQAADRVGEIAFTLDLGSLQVEQTLVDGSIALLLANESWERPTHANVSGMDVSGIVEASPIRWLGQSKVAIAIDLSTGELIDRLELRPGYIQGAAFANGQATIALQPSDIAVAMIFPPIEVPNQLYRFRVTAEGISTPTLGSLPSGHTVFQGDRVAVASPRFAFDENTFDFVQNTTVRVFDLAADGVSEIGELNIAGTVNTLWLSAAAESLRIVATERGPQQEQSVQVISASLQSATLTVTQRLELGSSVELLSLDEDYLLFWNWPTASLTLVTPDATGQLQAQSIEIADSRAPIRSPIRVDADRILVATYRVSDPEFQHPFELPPWRPELSPALATISLSTGQLREVQGLETLGQQLSGLVAIDRSQARFGFETTLISESGEWTRNFVVGRLDAESRFILEGSVTAPRFDTHFVAGTSYLQSITGSRALGYDYRQLETPTFDVRLKSNQVPPLQAVNDQFRLFAVQTAFDPRGFVPNGDWQPGAWLDVLANDQIAPEIRMDVRIKQLIDAPVGVELRGNLILVSAALLETGRVIEFGYTATDGIDESTDRVSVQLSQVTAAMRQEMLTAVRQRAAADFDVPEADVTVEWLPLNGAAANLPVADDLDFIVSGTNARYHRYTTSPLFYFRVTVPGAQATYRSDIRGNITQLESVQRTLVELTLVPTDDTGRPIDVIEPGQTFWLEFRGMDLRALGQGIFSTFLSFQVDDGITLDGTVEAGEGYALLDVDRIAEKISPNQVIDLGVVRASGESGGRGEQTFLRLKATAGEGRQVISLQPTAASDPAAEVTLFGQEAAVAEAAILRRTTLLTITDPEQNFDHRDVDRDGLVKPLDALRIINMMSRYGVGDLTTLATRMEGQTGSTEVDVHERLRRFDVNQSGTLSPLDALLVINHIGQQRRQAAANPSGEQPTEPLSPPLLSDPELD